MVKRKIVIALIFAVVLAMALSPVVLAQDQKIDINKATVEQLQTLKYVGEKYAQKIVDYRTAHGPFKTPEEIMNVKGIGQKIYEVNKHRIVVTGKSK